jgi:hypothetical protein
LFQAKLDAAGCCPSVVDLNPDSPVIVREEPVQYSLPSVTKAIHTRPDENAGNVAFGRFEQNFQVPRAHHADVGSFVDLSLWLGN